MDMAIPAIEHPTADYAACSGCALCLLVCPIWRQTGDVELTPLGCSKALQFGAAVEALVAAAQWCNLCGACAPVCPEGIDLVGLMRSLRRPLPGTSSGPEAGPGEPLISQSAVRRRLGAGDLVVIETRSYHADYESRVKLYDGIRRETGCMLSLDLQRIAIPARLPSPAGHPAGCDDLAQARWIVQGRTIQRIVVEDPADCGVFERLGGWPVISMAQLAQEPC